MMTQFWCLLLYLLCSLVIGNDLPKFSPLVTKVESQDLGTIDAFLNARILLRLLDSRLEISKDNGLKWSTIGDLLEVDISSFFVDTFYPDSRAFAVSNVSLFVTENKGDDWKTIDISPFFNGTLVEYSLVSSPISKDYFILNIISCVETESDFIDCSSSSLISNDSGETFTKIESTHNGLNDLFEEELSVVTCEFIMKSRESRISNNKSIICQQTVLDNSDNDDSNVAFSTQVMITENFGKTLQVLDDFHTQSIVDLVILDDYIVIITQNDKFNKHTLLKVWVSNNGKNFEQAILPVQIRSSFVTVISGYNGRIIIKINKNLGTNEDATQESSEILISDTRGLKFKVLSSDVVKGSKGSHNIGLVPGLKNVLIDTFHHYKTKKSSKRISKISIDNGKTWKNMRIIDPGNSEQFPCDIDDVDHCSLYIDPSSQLLFEDKQFSSLTYGVIMTTGLVLGGSNDYQNNLNTFLSRDGGITWSKVLSVETKYAFDLLGNVIIAVPSKSDSDGRGVHEFYYSLDQGHSWNTYLIEDTFFPLELSSIASNENSTTFILTVMSLNNGDYEHTVYSSYIIDFSKYLNNKICQEKDIEKWVFNDGMCVNGQITTFRRKKPDSNCIFTNPVQDLQVSYEACDCSPDDYECGFEFSRDENGECVPDYSLISRSSICKDKEIASIRPRVLEMNSMCKNPLNIESVEISCIDMHLSSNENIFVSENTFSGRFKSYQYFDSIEDESFIVKIDNKGLLISHDGGQTITDLGLHDNILEIVFNPFFGDSAYLFTSHSKLYLTHDRGHSFSSVSLPNTRQLGFPLSFHAKDRNTFIYYGGRDCKSIFNPNCHVVAYITRDGGTSFEELLEGAISCNFVGSTYEFPYNENMIMCETRDKVSGKKSLYTSVDFFKNDKVLIYDEIIGYMSTGDFTVIAIPYGDQELRAYVTTDGHEFAEAKFPSDFYVAKQEAYTILGSETGAIFFHVTTYTERHEEFGALMKSNSNGTSFVVLERAVNRNGNGFVDFEKIYGLEGIIIINVVLNAEEIMKHEKPMEEKRLKTKITFNDGADWSYIKPPSKDSKGKKYKCSGKSLDKCSLNLHGYTERKDPRDTYSSSSALGMLIAVGNVGEYLLPLKECSTFMTTDGGITWKEIRKGSYHWEYGDRGSIIILVNEEEETDTIIYSTDSGNSWNDFKFSQKKIYIRDILTVPQDSSMRFLLIGELSSIQGQQTITYSVDFMKCFSRQCVLDPNGKNSDFEYRPVKKPGSSCLFGHEAQYLVKKHYDCYIGTTPLKDRYKIMKNCSCTRADFECDYNFYKAKDGTCKLVDGLSSMDPSDICKKNDQLIEYYDPSGYRKIPLSTCDGGLRLDKYTVFHPCPGKEKEFNEKYHVGSGFIFIIWILFSIIFVLALWFIYDRGIRRNGGFSRFGEIRLGDDDLIEENTVDRCVNSIVRGGVFLFSRCFGVVQLFKREINNNFQRVRENIWKRGGPSYSSLVHDQFLDEADDLLAGHDDDANDLASFLEHDGNFEVENEDPESNISQIFSDNGNK